MSTTRTAPTDSTRPAGPHVGGWLSRLGAWSATHLRVVLTCWRFEAVYPDLGRQVESALSGGGWQDSGSQSIAARDLIAKDFAGLGSTALQVVVHDSARPVTADSAAQRVIAQITAELTADRERDDPRGRCPDRSTAQAVHDVGPGTGDRGQRAVGELQQGQPRRDDQV